MTRLRNGALEERIPFLVGRLVLKQLAELLLGDKARVLLVVELVVVEAVVLDADAEDAEDAEEVAHVTLSRDGIPEFLLDSIEQVLPLGPDEWESVVENHAASYPTHMIQCH